MSTHEFNPVRFAVTSGVADFLDRENVEYRFDDDRTADVSIFYVPGRSRFDPPTRISIVDSYATVIASTGKMTFFEFVDFDDSNEIVDAIASRFVIVR